MTGAARAFELVAQAFDRDIRYKILRIHIFRRRREDEVDAFRERQLGIARQVARVALEVFAGAELRRVDKDRSHDDVAHFAGAPHQRQMTFVQRAHRRHQADAAAFGAHITRHRHHSRNAVDDLHRRVTSDK